MTMQHPHHPLSMPPQPVMATERIGVILQQPSEEVAAAGTPPLLQPLPMVD